MSGICDTNKSIPDGSSSLITAPKAGFFDITGSPTKLNADQTIPGSTDGTIQYNDKINPREIPYLKYTDLVSETGNILPIATASAAIRTGENSYVVFYPSYYNASSDQAGAANVQLTNGQAGPANNVSLTGVPKNAEHKIPNVNFQGKTYTIYIIPTSTSMSGGAGQQGGSLVNAVAYTNLLNASAGTTHSIEQVQAMVEAAGDLAAPMPVPTTADDDCYLYLNKGKGTKVMYAYTLGERYEVGQIDFSDLRGNIDDAFFCYRNERLYSKKFPNKVIGIVGDAPVANRTRYELVDEAENDNQKFTEENAGDGYLFYVNKSNPTQRLNFQKTTGSIISFDTKNNDVKINKTKSLRFKIKGNKGGEKKIVWHENQLKAKLPGDSNAGYNEIFIYDPENKTITVEGTNQMLCVDSISSKSAVNAKDTCRFKIEIKKNIDGKYYFEVDDPPSLDEAYGPSDNVQVFNIFGNQQVKTFIKRDPLRDEELFDITILTNQVVSGGNATYKISYN